MIKLVVMDLDGTVLPYGQKTLSERTKDLIRQLKEKGTTVVFSSGRTYGEMLPYLSEWEDIAFFTCCEGAYTIYQGKEIYERKIELEDLVRFFRLDPKEHPFVLHGTGRNYIVGEPTKDIQRFEPIPIQRIGEISEKVFKVTVCGGAIQLPPLCGLRLQWEGGTNGVVQYVNRFVNKGTALSNLQMRLLISGFETACIGDSENDISMMKNAKISYCIGQRSKELYAICNHHADSAETALMELLQN